MKLRRLLACTSVVWTATVAHAGNDISGGGRIISHQYNPWFIGVASVDYCVEIGEISASSDAAKSAVRDVLRAWSEVLPQLKSQPTSFMLRDGQAKALTMQFNELASCTDATPLKFRIGIVDDDVRDTVGDDMGDFIAFAKRTHYEVDSGMSRGYVWVTPDSGEHAHPAGGTIWHNPEALRQVLLHEIGHVIGLRHTQGRDAPTFMQESYPQEVVALSRRHRAGQPWPYGYEGSPRDLMANNAWLETQVPLCEYIRFELGTAVSVHHLDFLTAVIPGFPREDVDRNPRHELYRVCTYLSRQWSRLQLRLDVSPGHTANPTWRPVVRAEIPVEGRTTERPLSTALYAASPSLSGLTPHSFLVAADASVVNRPELEAGGPAFRYEANRDGVRLSFVADNRFHDFTFRDLER